MSFFRRLSFGLWYMRRPPWDSRIVPPEVEEFLHSHDPARALDLGCGTGTSSLALARAGWTVTGVDFIPRAINIAKQKMKQAGLKIDFRVGDVSRLHGVRGPFELVLDIGCFHGLSAAQKTRYLEGLEDLIAPGGTWLLYGFFNADESPGPGFVPADLARASRHLSLVHRQDGMDKENRPSAWFWFQK
jgi:SAM-dependent methyltransferase